ncbi:MAG: polyphosphate kinase 1 [Mariprofundales bacterium]
MSELHALLDIPSNFINREISLLAFNQRVLELGQDESVPLIERLRFLCISASNLDEFFEVRVAAMQYRLASGSCRTKADGLTPQQVLKKIRQQANKLMQGQYALLNDTLLPAMAAEGIRFVRRTQWSDAQTKWIANYFTQELQPVLSPLGIDPAHPFPRILTKSLNFIISLQGHDAFGREHGIAIVQAPRSLPRVIRLPRDLCHAQYAYVFLSSIIHAHVHELFSGMKVMGSYQFRVTRNSELYVDEEETEDLKQALAGELPGRRYGDAVRLEIPTDCSDEMRKFLQERFNLNDDDIYLCNGPVNLTRLMAICGEVDRSDLQFPQFTPGIPEVLQKQDDMFAAMRNGDILLHHPYQSFQPVINLIKQAADDPLVLAIRMALYRTGAQSEIIEHLVRAARNGKEVLAVVELRARFDEEENINVSEKLQEAGAHVVYGVVGYKTHAKLLLIVRREKNGLQRYVHLGTGNYHTGTAKAYTDYGLLSCDSILGEDMHRLFQQLSGVGAAAHMNKIVQAPFDMHNMLLKRIEHETEVAKSGKKAHIMARMNGLQEKAIILALYRASVAGVRIDLLVRGICCLRPGLKGVSENIRVRSVMGRFLEHSRLYYFYNNGKPILYGASADWMERNLLKRVESCFPFNNPTLAKQCLRQGMRLYFADNCQAWELQDDASYKRKTPKQQARRNAQSILLQELAHN